MKSKNKANPSVSFRVLAEGYCKSIKNGARLIDDGIILFNNNRYLGAMNSFRLACEEIIKAHLFNQPVGYGEKDQKKWDWFWSAFRSHSEKQKILLVEFHRNNIQSSDDFHKQVKLMVSTRNDSIYVKFDLIKNRFLSPEESLKLAGDLKTTAVLELKYAKAILKMFTLNGMPTVDSIEKVFIWQHEHEKKKREEGDDDDE